MKYLKHKNFIVILFSSFILVGIIIYLKSNPKLIVSLRNISFNVAANLILLRIIFLGLNGFILKLFAEKLEVDLQLKEWIGLPYITTMGNYITPLSGGMLARAVYLKSSHSLSFMQFATLLTANYLITFWGAGLIGLIITIAFICYGNSMWLLIGFFCTVFIVFSGILFLPLPKLPKRYRLLKSINMGIEGWITIRRDKRLMWSLNSLTLVSIVINGFTFWVAYNAVDASISLAAALLVSMASLFTVIITVTPGNFGIREGFISLISGIIGAGGGEGLLVALLIRASTVVPAFTLGPIFAYILSREWSSSDIDLTKKDI